MKLVPLTKDAFAQVDDDDFDRIMAYGKWCLHDTNKHTNYAYNHKRGMVLLHRFIMEPPKGMDVHHADGDGLNCQRSNMKIVSRSENLRLRNSWSLTGYKGVTKTKGGRYAAQIKVKGNAYHLGSFDTAELAAIEYNRASLAIFGPNAYQNKISVEEAA